jgi:short-subunit dehydrogenase
MSVWQGKKVWITGGSSGIGRAMAQEFYRAGARLILSSNEEDMLHETREFLEGSGGGRVRTLFLDITMLESIEEKAAEARSFYGGIDVLVNNAGLSQRALLTETAVPVIQKLMTVNLLGQIVLTRWVVPEMIGRRSGCIIGVSSLVGKIGSPLRTVYSASKHGLHGFYNSLRAEVDRYGVQVTLGVPGFVRTEISKHAMTGDGSRYAKMDRNQERGIPPEQCAREILRGAETGKLEVHTGMDRRARLALFLQCRLPKVLARNLAKAEVT